MLLAKSIGWIGAAGLILFVGGTANANGSYPQLSGAHLISAEGGSIDNDQAAVPLGDPGSIGLAGLINFNSYGGASSVNVTITYEDRTVDPTFGAEDGFTCVLTNPDDVSYSLSKGIGTLTLTVSSYDTCPQTTTGDPFNSNTGKRINFNLYVATNAQFQTSGRIEVVSMSLVDALLDGIVGSSLTGSIQ